jgi:transcriptional regulator with XRE-family HTH domain
MTAGSSARIGRARTRSVLASRRCEGRTRNSLGRVLAARREALGLSVGALAERAGTDPVRIVNYETDLVVPHPRTLERLAEILQTPAGRLLGLRRTDGPRSER